MVNTSEGQQPRKKHFWNKERSSKRPLSVDDITIVDQSMLKRAVGAAAFGNAMEWFDFGVYSFMAVTIGKVFFPGGSPAAQLLATFGAFAAAFLVPILGGDHGDELILCKGVTQHPNGYKYYGDTPEFIKDKVYPYGVW